MNLVYFNKKQITDNKPHTHINTRTHTHTVTLIPTVLQGSLTGHENGPTVNELFKSKAVAPVSRALEQKFSRAPV